MSTIFTFVSSILEEGSEAAENMELGFQEKEQGEYFGWHKHTRVVNLPSGQTVKQVYFTGFEKDSTDHPTELGVISMGTPPPGEFIWISDEGTRGIMNWGEGHNNLVIENAIL